MTYLNTITLSLLCFFWVYSPQHSDASGKRIPIPTSYHVRMGAPTLSKAEAQIAQGMTRWFSGHSRFSPQLDPGLRLAAQQLATSLAHGRIRRLSHQQVVPALWLYGRSDHQIRVFAMAFEKTSNFSSGLTRALASHLAQHRPNFYGIAVVKGKVKIGLLLFSRRGALLSRTSRLCRVGQMCRLTGYLMSGKVRPSVMIGTPHGRVLRPKVHRSGRNAFSVEWPVRWSGPMQVQVMVTDGVGPWITSQFEVHGWEPPTSQGALLRKVVRQYLRTSSLSPSARKKRPKPRALPKYRGSRQAPVMAKKLWKLVNTKRKRQQLSVLRRHPVLDALAQSHANDMAQYNYFAHTSARHGSFSERFQTLGWHVKMARENIVIARSPKQAHKFWSGSPSHRSNLIEPKFRLTGVGAAVGRNGKIYFVQVYVAR